MRRRLLTLFILLSVIGAACSGDAPQQALPDEPREKKPGARRSVTDDEADRRKKNATRDDNEREEDDVQVPPAARDSSGSKRDVARRAGGGGAASETAGQSENRDQARSGTPAPEPIPAGVHEYATDGRRTISGNTEEFPKTTTLTAERPDGELQRQTRDLRDRDGHGTVTETHLLYRKRGVFLTYVKVTSSFAGGFTDVREFRLPHPELIAPRGGGPGLRRSFTMKGSGTRADVSIEALRYETMEIGGSRIRSLVVRTDISFSGALEGEQHAVSRVWPKHLWVLKEHVRTDVRNGPIRLQSEYEAQLRRLPP